MYLSTFVDVFSLNNSNDSRIKNIYSFHKRNYIIADSTILTHCRLSNKINCFSVRCVIL